MENVRQEDGAVFVLRYKDISYLKLKEENIWY